MLHLAAEEARKHNRKFSILFIDWEVQYRATIDHVAAMRICEPFGPEQRRGLWLYHILEPETWCLACARVSGAASGARYVRHGRDYLGRHQIDKPAHHTWQSYVHFLLSGMPPPVAEHYRSKMQEGDTGSRNIPSWRRICKVIMRNDYWCRGLSFSPTKVQHYRRYI